MKKSKSRKKTFIVIFIVAVLIFISPYALELFDLPTSNSTQTVAVSVPEGSSTKQIAQLLKSNKLIRSKYIFLYKVKSGKYNNKLNYGIFKFQKNMTVNEIIKIIGENTYSKKTYSVTIPEGYSAEQTAQLFEQAGFIKAQDFISALRDTYNYSFLNDIPSGNYKYKLQGFLFPSTYEFYTTATAHDVIDRMLGEFNKRYGNAADSYDNIFEIITKASVIEKEAKLDSERAIIAGVIDNRLKENMLLQVDACVVYAITDGMYNVTKVYNSDLKIDSPYNTYKYKGLPAGPICNPGIKSIKAVLEPKASDYLYYHTDEAKNDGSHIFTKTFDEHMETMK